MAAARCPRCEAEHDGRANFCVRCGLPLGAAGAAPRSAAPDEQQARFVTCPSCGATNAASRKRCGRCKASFDEAGAPVGPIAPAAPAPYVEEPEVAPASRLVFGLVVTIAGLTLIGVTLSLLSGNGVGFLTWPTNLPAPEEDRTLAVSSVRASSVLPPAGAEAHEPANLLDGDPRTAWREDASGDGVGEWVELELEGSPEVTRVLLWNGYQRDDRAAPATRAAQVRIDLGERTFTADLLDVDGPQAVDLPEVVAASAVRLTILEVVPGAGDLALSGLEVWGPPANATDVDS